VTIVAWTLVIIGFIIGAAGVWEVYCDTGKFSLSNLSSLGSYLQGTVASVWSLAGFLLIYVTFLAQKRQLLQQDAELEDQKKQFQLQHDSIKQQNFESSFFQLLNNHNQILMAMTYSVGRGTAIGRGCFNAWHQELKLWDESEKKTSLEKYQALANGNQGKQLGHYFRNLYHLIKFVNNSEIKDKRRYTSLARATLSQPELALLFYNGLTALGEKFKPLIEDFGLLENFNKDLLLNAEDELLCGAKDGKPYKPEAWK
jgi:hypothetical protein